MATISIAPVSLQVVVEAAELLKLHVPDWAQELAHEHRSIGLHDASVGWFQSDVLERLYLEIMASSQRPDLGLLLGSSPTVARYGMLPSMIMNAPDLRAIIDVITHYAALTQERTELTFLPGPKVCSLSLSPLGVTVDGKRCRVEFVMAGLTTIFRLLGGDRGLIVQSCFPHPEPDYVSAYASYFDGEIRFRSEVAKLVFRTEALSLRLPGADIQVFQSLKLRADIAMAARRQRRNCAETVMDLLSDNLQLRPRMADVAQRMNLHERALRRELRELGTTYGELLEKIQLEQAMTLLCSPDMSIQQVASATGYVSVSAFQRAFVRRAGVPPGKWKKMHGA